MNIQPLKSEGVPPPPKLKTPVAKPAEKSAAEAAPEAGKHERLRAALAGEPAVRPDEVERGKALANDAGYPTDEALGRLAALFVEDAWRKK